MGPGDLRAQQPSNRNSARIADIAQALRWRTRNNSMNTRQRNFVVGLIVIGLMIIGFFGLRTVRAFRQFHGHRPPPPFTGEKAETNVDLIRDWMTLPYISIAYQLPPDLLYETLKIPPKGNERKSLKELNDEFY